MPSLYGGKAGTSSTTAPDQPCLHTTNRARVFFSGRERASPLHSAGPRGFVSWCAPGFSRLSQTTRSGHAAIPNFLAVPAAVQQAILYLCGEFRVACDLWRWSVPMCALFNTIACTAHSDAWAAFFSRRRPPSKKKKNTSFLLPAPPILAQSLPKVMP